MRRPAQPACAAVFLCGAICWLLVMQPGVYAEALAARRNIYLPSVVTTYSQMADVEAEAFRLINLQRRANGCPSVNLSRELTGAAEHHSQDMADHNYLSHTGWDGSTFWERALQASYQHTASGEVVARGQATAAQVVDAWMKSTDHRKIILTCANNDIGIGWVVTSKNDWRYYWTAVFGNQWVTKGGR